MEYKEVVGALAVVAVALIAIFSFSADYEAVTGDSITTDINATQQRINNITDNLAAISGSVGDAGVPEEGASIGTGDDNLVVRGLRILGAIPDLIGMPLVLLDDIGRIFKIDSRIMSVAKYTLITVFFLTLAYIFILGVRKILP